jgi:YD repeat-containing protein
MVQRCATCGVSDQTGKGEELPYTYDGLNRLTQAPQPDPVNPLQGLTESFAYDPVGNRTASHLATGQVHDAANRLLEDSGFTSTYDATGSLASKTAKATGATTTYTYDVENRLVAVTGPGLTAGYAYDPLGRRIAKTVNSVVTRYVYDQEDILLECDGANVPQARYTHGPGNYEPLSGSTASAGAGWAACGCSSPPRPRAPAASWWP